MQTSNTASSSQPREDSVFVKKFIHYFDKYNQVFGSTDPVVREYRKRLLLDHPTMVLATYVKHHNRNAFLRGLYTMTLFALGLTSTVAIMYLPQFVLEQQEGRTMASMQTEPGEGLLTAHNLHRYHHGLVSRLQQGHLARRELARMQFEMASVRKHVQKL